jgi:TRAP-type C4-dicarboxylate transport system permease small subunit
MERIDRAQRAIGRAVSYAFLAVAAAIAWEVAARYLFGAPTIWAHELTAALTAIAFLFGGAYAMARGEHIRITSLYDRFPARLKRAADVFASLVALFYVGALT